MNWIGHMGRYLAIDFPGEIWRAIFGKNFLGKWWDSHYL
jgi:hypothetical protein